MSGMSSLLTDLNLCGEERIQSIHGLFHICHKLDDNQADRLTAAISSLLKSKTINDRIAFWKLIPLMTQSSHAYRFSGCLCACIDKLHFHLQSVEHIAEMNAVTEAMYGFMGSHFVTTEFTEKVENSFTRIVTTILKLAKSASNVQNCLFGLNLLTAISESRGHNLFFSQGSAINNLCISLLLRKDLTATAEPGVPTCITDAAATLLALNSSFGPAEVYDQVWRDLTAELACVVKVLGLGCVGAAVEGRAGFTCKGDGLHKALCLGEIFRGVSRALIEMSRCGNSTGTVYPDVVTFLKPAVSAVVCHRIDLSILDPKFVVPNEFSISPAHLSVVAVQLKTLAMSVLRSLLLTPLPTVDPLSLVQLTCKCLSSVLSPESSAPPCVEEEALLCFRRAVRCFPAAILEMSSGSVQCLVRLLSDAMHIETSMASDGDMVGVKRARSDEVETDPRSRSRVIMETCEVLLIMAAPLLPMDTREKIELTVALGLRCLVKGVLQPHVGRIQEFPNVVSRGVEKQGTSHTGQKRIRRAICEPIRCSPELQVSLLRLACAEVMSVYSDGSRSGNVSLLKHACLACSALEVTAVEAGRVALCVENILFPSGGSIPRPQTALCCPNVSVSAVAAAQSRIDEHSEAEMSRTYAKEPSPVHIQPASCETSTCRDNMTASNCLDDRANTDRVTPIKPPPTSSGVYGTLPPAMKLDHEAPNESANYVSDGENSDSSDDLPDIDIDADPDSMS